MRNHHAETRKYRVELGLNLHAAPIPQTNPNLRIFPLQNALIDITGGEGEAATPAWYSRLCIGDELSFRLVDLGHRRTPERESAYPRLVLANFYFDNPLTGQPANPFTERILEWRFSERLDDRPSPAFSLDSTHRLATWNIVGSNVQGEEMASVELADFRRDDDGDDHRESDDDRRRFRAFELAVVIKMVHEGWVNHYVFDPEMIVSETDNEGDQSGGGTKR